ncbi:MAG TPA: LytTR family DNA-binding domain-containing protein [Longimicrobium sp.]|jgi:two-component system LytT family response regulator
MERIRTLIVDDEILSRQRLRSLLSDEPGIEVVGEATTGVEALAAIQELRPSLVFLDVQMPEFDGFQVVAQLDPREVPAIVFATGYDEFAIRAFEANAVDYLLKPIRVERLRSAITRVVERLRTVSSGSGLTPEMSAILDAVATPGGYRERFAVKSGNRYLIVRSASIVWMEAADNYVRFHTATETHLFRAKMADLEKALDPRTFLRIHRSIIINVDKVQSIESWGMSEHLFVLQDGTKLTSSRRYRSVIRAVFGV